MRFARERLFVLGTTAVILFSAIMVVRQVLENQVRHAEMREAFIFLYTKGYNIEAQNLYTRLVLNLREEPTRHLIDDLQRTSTIAPTNESASTNVLVRYHLSVKKELEKRFEDEYLKARKIAEGGS